MRTIIWNLRGVDRWLGIIALIIVMNGAHASQTLTILSPRGGEVYVSGQTYLIQLDPKTHAKSVRVELSRDGGMTFESVGTIDNTVKDRSKRNVLAWTPAGTASANCLIRVSAGTTTLNSPPFTIGAGTLGTGAPPANSVTTSSIQDGSITVAKLDPSLETRYVHVAGDTMTGMLTLAGDPTNNLNPASKQYVDGGVNAKVSKAGDTMTGALTLPVNGLTVGTSQLAAVGGNIGVGTTTPASPLEVFGNWNGLDGAFRLSGDKPTMKFFGGALTGNQAWILHLGSDGPGNLQFFRATGPLTFSNVLTLGANGDVGIGVIAPTSPLQMASGAVCTAGGVWTNASDRNLKEHLVQVDAMAVLENVSKLPVFIWNYKNENEQIRHIGPMAQDFHAIFGLGNNDTSISTIDPAGIALVCIQELRQRNIALQTQNAALSGRVEKLEARLQSLIGK